MKHEILKAPKLRGEPECTQNSDLELGLELAKRGAPHPVRDPQLVLSCYRGQKVVSILEEGANSQLAN